MTFRQWLSTVNPLKLFEFFLKDTVSKNALILLSTWCMNAAAGFVFIFIAARMYTIDSLGIATLLFSYASIVILITRFGIEQSMIRFYDEKEKSSIYCSSIFITTVSAMILGLFLISLSYFGVSGSDYLFMYSAVFLIGLIILSISGISGIFFLASGKPLIYLFENAIISSRFIFLLIFIPFGVMGIFCSLIIATGLSAIFSLVLILQYGVKFQLPKKKFILDSFQYSASNYISDFCLTAPIFLIPIVVFFISGQKETAIYSVSYAVASIAFLIPTSIGYALFMSGCREKTTIPSMKIVMGSTLVLLSGIILVFFFWGKDIVNVLGPDYSGTADLIVLIMSSSIFALFFQIYSAEFKILRQMKKLLILNCVFFITLMCLSYIFVMNLGLIGTGYAWIAAYAICIVPLVFYTQLNNKHAVSNEGNP